MNINGRRQVLGPATDAQRVARRPRRLATTTVAPTRATLFRTRSCVALLAAFLLLPAGQASTENNVAGYGDCDTASVDGGIPPATAGSHGARFNEVFGLNSMAKGETASPSPFRRSRM